MIKLCGVGILCLWALLCVKNLREGYAPMIRAASSVLFGVAVISHLMPLLDFGERMASKSGLGEYGETLLKALGIAYLTGISAGVCRDFGESNLASSIENVGKIELMLLALPLFEAVLYMAEDMLSW